MVSNSMRTIMAVAFSAASGAAMAATPLGTAFAYQGRLKSAGAPLNATADFQFSLWDAAGSGSPPTGGTQIGGTQAVNNLTVAGGLFTVQLNAGGQFGAAAFNGDARWLQIAVRSPAGSGPFTTLSPRQLITATPYAAFAARPWVTSGSNISYTAGNVGVGTEAPQASVHVNTPGEGIRIQGPTTGSLNQTWMSFMDAASNRIGYVGDGSTSDGSVYLTADSGNVILYTAAGAALTATASGAVKLGTQAEYFATAGEENLRIIRGMVDGAGNVVLGSGFQVSHGAPGSGEYTVTFNTPFTGPPVVTATAQNSIQQRSIWVHSVGGSASVVSFRTSFGATPTDANFYFIAIGPR
jgi:hypothetical protein